MATPAPTPVPDDKHAQAPVPDPAAGAAAPTPVSAAPSELTELTRTGAKSPPAIAHAIAGWPPARREAVLAEMQASPAHGNRFVGEVVRLLPTDARSRVDLATALLDELGGDVAALGPRAGAGAAEAQGLLTTDNLRLAERARAVQALLDAAAPLVIGDAALTMRLEAARGRLATIESERARRHDAAQAAISGMLATAGQGRAAGAGKAGDAATLGAAPKEKEEPAAATSAAPKAAATAPATAAPAAATPVVATAPKDTPAVVSRRVDAEQTLDARGGVESASATFTHDTLRGTGGSGEQLTAGGKVSADGFTLSAGAAFLGDQAPEGADNTTRAETKVGASFSSGSEGNSVGLNLSDVERTETGGVTHTGGVTLSGTGMKVDASQSTASTVAGTTTTTKGGGNFAIAQDSVVFGASGSSSIENEDGSGSARGGSGSIDLIKGSASGSVNASQTGTDGVVRGGSVSATLGKDEQSAAVSLDRGSQHFGITGGGGIKHEGTMAAPEQRADGKWVVRYSITWSGNANIGARGVAAESSRVAGLGGSGSATGALASSSSGERVFDSEAAAQSFQERGEFGATELPTDAAGALALAEGQVIADGSSGSLGVGAGAGAGGVSLSLGLELGRSSGLRVERGSGSTVLATLSTEDMLSVSAGLGSLMELRFGKSWGSRSWQTVSFDLSTASGQAAYEQLARSSPRSLPAQGWKVVATGEASSEGSSTQVSVPLLGKVSTGGTTTEMTSTDASGAVTETSIGEQTSGVNIALLGHASESHRLSVSDSAAGRRVLAESTVDSSWAQDASMQLASATGTKFDLSDAASSGKWTVTTAMTPEHLEAFARAVESGAIDEHARGGGNVAIDTTAIDTLREALRAAGKDGDARRKALATFIDDGGDVSLDQLMTFEGATPDHFLSLEGDASFLGIAGHERLGSQLGDLERRIGDPGADRPGILSELEAIRLGSLSRLANLRDPAKYVELPRQLRSEELHRIEAELERCEGLMERLSRLPAPSVTATAKPGAVAAAAAAQPDAAAVAAADAATRERSIQATMVKMRREDAYAQRTIAEHTRKIHQGGYGSYTPRADLDDGILVRGDEGAAYAKIDALFKDAERHLAEAESAERASLMPERDGDDRDRSLEFAKWSFEQASSSYRQAIAEYEAIKRRHPEQGDRWSGHHETPAAPPSAGGIYGGPSYD